MEDQYHRNSMNSKIGNKTNKGERGLAGHVADWTSSTVLKVQIVQTNMCLIDISYHSQVETSKQSNITRGVAQVKKEKIFFSCNL